MNHVPPKATIRYDRSNCEGFFVCNAVDPDNFEEVEGEQVVDLICGEEVEDGIWEKTIEGEEAIELAKQAAQGCPVDVIQVIEQEAEEVIAGPEALPAEA